MWVLCPRLPPRASKQPLLPRWHSQGRAWGWGGQTSPGTPRPAEAVRGGRERRMPGAAAALPPPGAPRTVARRPPGPSPAAAAGGEGHGRGVRVRTRLGQCLLLLGAQIADPAAHGVSGSGAAVAAADGAPTRSPPLE